MWRTCFCCCCYKSSSSQSISLEPESNSDTKSVVIYEATLIPTDLEGPKIDQSLSSSGFDPAYSIASESIAEVSEDEFDSSHSELSNESNISDNSEKSEKTVIPFEEWKTDPELIFDGKIDSTAIGESKVHHQSSFGKMYRETYPFVFPPIGQQESEQSRQQSKQTLSMKYERAVLP